MSQKLGFKLDCLQRQVVHDHDQALFLCHEFIHDDLFREVMTTSREVTRYTLIDKFRQKVRDTLLFLAFRQVGQ